ncbi:uncharacterized protein B0I36DRAFT_101040 [Microdochium trichocladiopsis]|uniref:Uncharacterized protein n=1 Tax=Microdochium trichocladiopsis TaxID=1682393 RepID=A0A9P8YB16_9PEZI|nr:uncharacterized protein B0I36DRAFT_101040 [Microdochium trichocladiopsis]KAH7032828.1 hypothetical protein B0I36DRAFT_101040 [Microdochium trichocladiopsis]
MGSGFGEAVSSLLATYGRCLKLLKAFKGHHSLQQPGDGGAPSVASQSQTSLRQSIRSDRSRIRKAYSARLYREGGRLSKGDSVSRSNLRGIIRKLRAALVNILNLAKTQQPAIDYDALTALSNASRIDAIRTMDDLSQRLHRPSRGSLKSSSSKTSSSADSQSRKRGRRRSPKEKLGSKASGSLSIEEAKGPDEMREASRRSHARSRSSRHLSRDHHQTSGPSAAEPATKRRRAKLTKQHADCDTFVHTRVSYISMSSDSTKLGEIPYRGSRLVRHLTADEESLSHQATYPLYAHQPVQQGKVGLLRRLFR